MAALPHKNQSNYAADGKSYRPRYARTRPNGGGEAVLHVTAPTGDLPYTLFRRSAYLSAIYKNPRK